MGTGKNEIFLIRFIQCGGSLHIILRLAQAPANSLRDLRHRSGWYCQVILVLL